jgi:hypothetical protein
MSSLLTDHVTVTNDGRTEERRCRDAALCVNVGAISRITCRFWAEVQCCHLESRAPRKALAERKADGRQGARCDALEEEVLPLNEEELRVVGRKEGVQVCCDRLLQPLA